MMKSLSALFVAAAFVLGASTVHAQADPTATRNGVLQVGAAYSNANSDEVVRRIGGASFYATYDLFKNFGVETDVHLLDFQTPDDFAERSYLVGLRYSRHFHHFQPYIKALAGIGQTVAQESYVVTVVGIPGTPGTYGAYAFGGGLDYRLTRHVNIRAVDFEQQLWPSFSSNGLSPKVLSFGAAYRFP